MKRRQKMLLGSTGSEHEKSAAYHRGSAEHAIDRGLKALEQFDCSTAFHELLSARLYAGAYEAHLEAAGKKSSGSGRLLDIHRLIVDVGKVCLRPKSDFVVRKQSGRGKN